MYKLYSIEGNRQKLDGGAMFGNAPRAMWQRWLPPDELGRIELACRTLLLVSETTKILCETGIGAFFPPKLADRFGVEEPNKHILLENLEQHGVNHKDIDYVVLSHLHFDHAGGLLPSFEAMEQGDTDLLFPKAQYLVSKKAFARSKAPHPRDKASFIPEIIEKLEGSKRLMILDDPQESHPLGPEISFFESHGHSPGQMHLTLEQNSKKIIFCGDLIPGTHWINPALSMGYDRYPELLLDEKKKLLDRAMDNKTLLFFTHDPQFCASYAHSVNKKIRPLDPIKDMTTWG